MNKSQRTQQPGALLHKKAPLAVLPFAVCFSLFSAPLSAQNNSNQSAIESALDRAAVALSQEQNLKPETVAALQALVNALRNERAAAKPPETKPATAVIKPPSRFKMSGDVRLRHESSFGLDSQPSRHRERVRFRVGGTYQVSDQVTAGVRLSTGQRTDANSPHVTLGEVFHRMEASFDRLYLSYRPKGVPGLTATAGKFQHPFFVNPVYGELVWDADVQPEGVMFNYSKAGKGAIERMDFSVGEYLLLEQPVQDSRSFVAQAALHAKMGKKWKPSLALGYYRYGDLTPAGAGAILGENSGNATVGAGPTLDFASRFNILNSILAMRYDKGKKPLVFSAEYIKNLKAGIPQDTGYAFGAALGSARKRGDWRYYYQWQNIGQDAVLSVVSQDDFLLQTNHRSHLLGTNYQVRDNIGFHLWGLVSQRDRLGATPTTDSSKHQWRLRFDTNVTF
jgi:hypothetical protein